jgi:hypothetical protein
MKDRENNQPQGVQLPPAWCGAICRNAMNEICIEHCATERDCSAFEPKPNLKLSDMPRFPLNASAEMTKGEKFTSVTVYLAKVVDHLQGNEDEAPIILSRATRVNINTEIAGIASSLQHLQNETAIAKANGNSSNEIYNSGSTANKEQE